MRCGTATGFAALLAVALAAGALPRRASGTGFQMMGDGELRELRDLSARMFRRSFDDYMARAYPHDELKPL